MKNNMDTNVQAEADVLDSRRIYRGPQADLKGKHVIITTKRNQNHDIADRVFYVKLIIGAWVHGEYTTFPEKNRVSRASIERFATDAEIEQARKKLLDSIEDEMCTCGHLKSMHTGLNGGETCTLCSCERFTWHSWIIHKTIWKKKIKNQKEPD